MDDIPAGRTPWEAEQFAADHGEHAMFAQAFAQLGAIMGKHRGIPLPPRKILVSVHSLGTDEERKAVVDGFAAEFGLTAEWDGHSYRAVLRVGPITYEVYYVPDRLMAEYFARQSYAQNVQVAA